MRALIRASAPLIVTDSSGLAVKSADPLARYIAGVDQPGHDRAVEHVGQRGLEVLVYLVLNAARFRRRRLSKLVDFRPISYESEVSGLSASVSRPSTN